MKNGTDIALRISVYVDLGHIWVGQTANLDFSSAHIGETTCGQVKLWVLLGYTERILEHTMTFTGR